MSDLPQPIYPTPGPGSGAPAGPPPSWPPAGPSGPPSPGGPVYGGPPPPGGPPSKAKLSPMVWVVLGLAVLGAVIVGLVALGSSDGGGTASKGGSDVTVTTVRTGQVVPAPDTEPIEPDTGSGTEPDTEPDTGSGTEPDTGSGTEPDTGGSDVEARAQTVAANQILGASSSTVDCLAQELVDDTALLDVLEPQAAGVAFEAEEDARYYASFIMLCAAPDEVKQLFLDAYSARGLGQVELGCLDAAMDLWIVEEWVEFVSLVAQPARSSEADDIVTELTYC